MASFKLYSSNRLESLLDCLAGVVSEPLSSPLGREVILVQSKGMERWLSMELAHKLGIWMNCRFPFPNTFVWEMFKVVLEDVPDASMFSPQVMTWRIMGLLREHLEEPAFKVLRDYLGERADTLLKMLQLAERIADLFDRYAVYRPDMVLRWEEGVDEHWQAALWRDLATYGEGKHRAAIWRMLMERLKSGKVDPKLLPERVSVFGIPALPHYHFEVLRGLATLIDVHFFVMNPTREYWADIVPERRIADASQKDLHFDVGNPLLASMGKLGRDFFAMAMNGEPEEHAVFEDPGDASLLAIIQSDILHLRSRGDAGEKTVLPSDDLTVQVHSCHSPMREIEVLYDNLLALFDSHPDLTPRDIIVMTPDIETYAPYITAVFGRDQDGKAGIPFSIADRRAPSESHTIDVFLKIIGLCRGRLGASDVLDILDSTPVQKRFGLDAGDMDLILEWVRNSGIRWGIDGEHRSRLGLPDFKENSWEAGIERLLLGYALRGNEERLFSDILPYDDMEGNETEVLGRFLEFLNRLFVSVRELESSRTLSEWAEVLKRLKSDFIADEEEKRRDLLLLQTEITDL
ncbi:MAG: exodeoxyribonuclease V subunit gamma, partial [Syntrophobacteraceae bacterium]|nr:exodeoxyribonuclease V subunit gamma [Syntrophobacteraceae bacterium]